MRVVRVFVCGLLMACGGSKGQVQAPAAVLPQDVRLVPQIGHAATTLAMSPDGSLIASAGDGAIKVWSMSSGLLVQSFATVHDRAVAFAPDGKSVVASGRAVVTWSLDALGAPGREESGPSFGEDAGASYRAIALSPDGKRRAFGMEGVIRPGTGLRVVDGDRTWTGDTAGDVLAVAYSRDGKALVTLGKDGITRAWDPALGKQRWASESAGALEWWSHTGIAFAPTGDVVATCEHRRGIAIRKLGSGELVRRLADACSGVTFLDNATLVVFGPASKAIDIADGTTRWAFPGDLDAGFGVATPDGKLLAIAGDRGLQVWTATGQLMRSLRGQRAPAVAGCMSSDGAVIVAVRPSTTDTYGPASVEVWSMREARQSARWTVSGPSYQTSGARWEACAIAPDGRSVVIPTLRGLRVLELATGTVRELANPTILYQVAFVPGRAELIAASQDDVYRLALADGKVLATYKGAKLVEAIGISRDGARVAATTTKSETITWDATTAAIVTRQPTAALRRGDQTIAFRDREVLPDLNPHESRVVSADDRRVVQLEDGELTTLDASTGKRVGRTIALASQQQQQIVGLTGDARSVLVIDSAMLRVVRLDTGNVFTLAADDDDWLVYTEDGYFDSSRNAGAMLAAARGLEVYRIDQLALRNNRPDKILERTGLANPDAIRYYHARYLRRLQALGLDETSLSSKLGDAPTAVIRSADVDGDHAALAIEMDAPGGLLAYEVYVNGVALHGGGGIRVTGTHAATTVKIPLTSGDNRIEVGAISKSGVEGLRPTRVVRRDGKPARRELYFVGFGVSKYKNPDYNLDYPSKDIVDLADVMRDAPGFDAVHVATFVDADAKVEAFAKAKLLLAQARVDDTVVVFIAGHGLHAQDATAEYYFATHETDVADLPHTAASFSVIDSLLDGIAARRKLMLLDTCESGDLVADTATTVTASKKNLGSRSLVRVKTDKPTATPTPTATPSPRPTARPREYVLARDRFILADLARRTGAVVLASSRGEELSYESAAVQNGLFTQAMLLALTGPDADTDRDGGLSPHELRAFVTRNVAASTDDLQHPTIDVDNPFANIVLPLAPSKRAIADR